LLRGSERRNGEAERRNANTASIRDASATIDTDSETPYKLETDRKSIVAA